jgi:hypothetical protein
VLGELNELRRASEHVSAAGLAWAGRPVASGATVSRPGSAEVAWWELQAALATLLIRREGRGAAGSRVAVTTSAINASESVSDA